MAIYWSNGHETSSLRVRRSSRVSGRGNGNARYDGGGHAHENAYASVYACGGEGGGVNECDCADGCGCADDYVNGYADPRRHPPHGHDYARSPNHDQPTVPLPNPRQGRIGHSGLMMDRQRIDCRQCYELHRFPPRI